MRVPRPQKSVKSRLNFHSTILGEKINWFRPKEKGELKKGAHDLKNQDAS
jgi:hypothetical protein